MENVANFSAWLGPLFATDAPALPGLDAMRWGLHLLWALVLACGALGLAGRRRRGLRWPWVVAALVAAVTVVPTDFSPAHWLGLAFQSPSLTSAVLCGALAARWWGLANPEPLARRGRVGPGPAVETEAAASDAPKAAASASAQETSGVWLYMVGAAVLSGWVLGFDAWAGLGLSASVYAYGFSPAAIALVAAVALLPWVVGARRTGARALPFEVTVVLAVLLLFVVTRLPNGNLWDALLDPWLWVVLQVRWWIALGRQGLQR
ncbi:hypothetical protein [Rhodoferax sp. OV413]|uniref:hypothetical protein n=1 Tax=Rhodoferax sp. OV413 TaxID=1855285 RepID=UPI0025F1910A|nr:hypothetical protein [Rhodoferax sp. OV413]